MAAEVSEVIEAALSLSPRDRATLASRLLASLDAEVADQATVDAAWSVEIERRVDEVLSGTVGLDSFDEVYERISAALAAKRR